VPDNVLFCPTCAAKRSDEALWELQREFLRRCVLGDYQLRITQDRNHHVLLYTTYTRTFCGRELAGAPKIKYEPYDDGTIRNLCAGCRGALAGAIQAMTTP
jgi:hypothetical protein